MDADAATHDLQPWADPFIAELVAKYRLRAALDDSLHYLTHESSIPRGKLRSDRASTNPCGSHLEPRRPAGLLPREGRRFNFPVEGESES